MKTTRILLVAKTALGWELRDYSGIGIQAFKEKTEAVRAGEVVAAANQPSILRIQDDQGIFSEERSFIPDGLKFFAQAFTPSKTQTVPATPVRLNDL